MRWTRWRVEDVTWSGEWSERSRPCVDVCLTMLFLRLMMIMMTVVMNMMMTMMCDVTGGQRMTTFITKSIIAIIIFINFVRTAVDARRTYETSSLLEQLQCFVKRSKTCEITTTTCRQIWLNIWLRQPAGTDYISRRVCQAWKYKSWYSCEKFTHVET